MFSRHGERERLVKHHTTLQEIGSGLDGGPQLTPDGLKQLARVGQVLNKLYFAPSCSHEDCLAGSGTIDRHQIHAESSSLARTLSTALVILQHLLPPNAYPTPIYSLPDSMDYRLRGYAGSKCATFVSSISKWQSSPEFVAKENESAQLRALVGQVLREHQLDDGIEYRSEANGTTSSVTLRDWWNAWDTLSVSEHQLVSEIVLKQVQQLVAWVESHKVRTASLVSGDARQLHPDVLLDAALLSVQSARARAAVRGAARLFTDRVAPSSTW